MLKNNNFEEVFSKLEPDSALKEKIISRMEENEVKKNTKKNVRHIAAIAACIALAGITTAFAAGGVISYFQNDNAGEITYIAELNKYNDEIGVSDSKFGYTLTLDNVAVDDNFIHLFTTLKSNDKPFYEGEKTDLVRGWYPIDVSGRWWIDGEELGTGNHNEYDGYFPDKYTYKQVLKYNISTMDISDVFRIECVMEKYGENPPFAENQGEVNITDYDKKNVIYISADIDKSKVKAESVTKEINRQIPWLDSELEKVIFSPFGNQLVIKGRSSENITDAGGFALYDENGTSLDVLNTDSSSGRNSFEFLKADKNIKQLKFVPWKFTDNSGIENSSDKIYNKIGNYPIVYETSDCGKVVVTDVRISDNSIEIDYYKDGFVLYDPEFLLADDNGEEADSDINIIKHRCILYTHVHHDTNSYTAEYVYDYDKQTPEDITQLLKEKITSLGLYKDNVQLDYDNAVTVDLE